MMFLPRKYRILFIVVISLAILFLPGYVLFYSLSEIDLLRSDLNWESPDDIAQWAGFEKKWKISPGNIDSIPLLPEDGIFEPISLFSWQEHLAIDQSSVLRC